MSAIYGMYHWGQEGFVPVQAKMEEPLHQYKIDITNSFYCEYVRMMLPKIADMVEHMKLGNVDYLPDIFAISSEVLVEIVTEYSKNTQMID